MIWLTWRQFRAQALWIYGATAVVAVILVITGAQLADLADTAGSALFDALNGDRWKNAEFNLGFMAVISFPAIVGVFWGAPLIARELETGTHRLAWNQTVTRTGWLATKLAVIGLAAMIGVGLLSLLFTWWCGPLDDAVATSGRQNGLLGAPRIAPPMFGAHGIVPIGYTAFAIALGVASGAVLRRTVPAMAVTLVVFVAVQILMPPLVRQHLGPTQLTTTITAKNLSGLMAEGPTGPVREIRINIDKPGAWDISNHTIDAQGNAVSTLPSWVMGCVPAEVPRGPQSDPQCFTRLERAGYRQQVTYQPADRFWTLQAIETAIFLALAAALTGFCFWWVRRLS
jgi:ABC-2 family transporter protein